MFVNLQRERKLCMQSLLNYYYSKFNLVVTKGAIIANLIMFRLSRNSFFFITTMLKETDNYS